jgi:hypothetical protein
MYKMHFHVVAFNAFASMFTTQKIEPRSLTGGCILSLVCFKAIRRAARVDVNIDELKARVYESESPRMGEENVSKQSVI